MQPRWNHARSAALPPRLTHRGAGRQGNIFSFRSREKNVLDFSSYRSGFFASYTDASIVIIVRSNFSDWWQNNLLVGVPPCLARVCNSEKQSRFSAEIAVHLPGLSAPHIFSFPKVVVCLDCGFTEFSIPETELCVLRDGIGSSAAAS